MIGQQRASRQTITSNTFSPQTLRGLAWVAWSLNILLIIAGILLFYLSGQGAWDLASEVSITIAFACFGTVGLLIALQRPKNTIGWLFCAIGIGTGTTTFSAAYPKYGTVAEHIHPLLPGASLIDGLGNFVWTIDIALFLVFLPLLFPTGRPLSRRWRIVVWLTLIVMALDDLIGIFFSVKIEIFGLVFKGSDANDFVSVLLVMLGISAFVSLILRFIRSRGNERQQMKWLTYGCAGMLALFLGGIFVWNDQTNFTFAVAIVCLPLSVGISILRYRLYDIDRLISRTLIYLLLSALLVLIYLGLVFGLQFILRPITASSNSPFPIVLSTLAIATLFQHLRRALQRVIDRSFYRRKYNAEQVLTTFGATLHTEIELTQLSERLLTVVVETMQPEHISLWLTAPVPRKSMVDTEG